MQMNEPVLLVGETGVGKTAVVNFLSKVTGKLHEHAVIHSHLFLGNCVL